MIDPSTLIIVGILIIGFGFWYKLYIAWYPKSSKVIMEMRQKIQEKLMRNQELSAREKLSLFSTKSANWLWWICSKVGVAMIAIGFILRITQ